MGGTYWWDVWCLVLDSVLTGMSSLLCGISDAFAVVYVAIGSNTLAIGAYIVWCEDVATTVVLRVYAGNLVLCIHYDPRFDVN